MSTPAQFITKAAHIAGISLLLILLANHIAIERNIGTMERACARLDGKVLVCGDSHMQKGVQESGNVVNISESAESYWLTYLKLSAITEYGAHPDWILLGIGHHNLAPYYDEYIDGPLAAASLWDDAHFLSYSYFMLAARHPGALTAKGFIKEVRFNVATALWLEQVRDILGGYSNEYTPAHSDTRATDVRLAQQYSHPGTSVSNLRWLDSVIALCQRNEIPIVGLSTPTSPYYRQNIPPGVAHSTKTLIDTRRIDAFIDYSDLDLPDSMYLPDGDHLNARGAQAFSQILWGSSNQYP